MSPHDVVQDDSIDEASEQNRTAEVRKVKSRFAARSRRECESELYDCLHQLIPLPEENTISHVDRIAVLRLALAYCTARSIFPGVCSDQICSNLSLLPTRKYFCEDLLKDATDGFLLVLQNNGGIVFVSTGVSKFLGLTQTDLIGENIYDYVQDEDLNYLKSIVDCVTNLPGERSPTWLHEVVHLRLKSVLTPRGRQLSLKSPTYRTLACTITAACSPSKVPTTSHGPAAAKRMRLDNGQLDDMDPFAASGSRYLLMFADPLLSPSSGTEKPFNRSRCTATSRHTMDMSFTYISENLSHYMEYNVAGLLGKSFYRYVHPADLDRVSRSFGSLDRNKLATVGFYRVLLSSGGCAWLYTEAQIASYGIVKRNKSDLITCTHFIVSRVIESGSAKTECVQRLPPLRNNCYSFAGPDSSTNSPFPTLGSRTTNMGHIHHDSTQGTAGPGGRWNQEYRSSIIQDALLNSLVPQPQKPPERHSTVLVPPEASPGSVDHHGLDVSFGSGGLYGDITAYAQAMAAALGVAAPPAHEHPHHMTHNMGRHNHHSAHLHSTNMFEGQQRLHETLGTQSYNPYEDLSILAPFVPPSEVEKVKVDLEPLEPCQWELYNLSFAQSNASRDFGAIQSEQEEACLNLSSNSEKLNLSIACFIDDVVVLGANSSLDNRLNSSATNSPAHYGLSGHYRHYIDQLRKSSVCSAPPDANASHSPFLHSSMNSGSTSNLISDFNSAHQKHANDDYRSFNSSSQLNANVSLRCRDTVSAFRPSAIISNSISPQLSNVAPAVNSNGSSQFLQHSTSHHNGSSLLMPVIKPEPLDHVEEDRSLSAASNATALRTTTLCLPTRQASELDSSPIINVV